MSALELLSALAGKPFEGRRNPDDLLRRKEAAAYLNVSVSYLRRLEGDPKREKPKVIKLSNNVIRYRVGDLDAWKEARTQRGQDHG